MTEKNRLFSLRAVLGLVALLALGACNQGQEGQPGAVQQPKPLPVKELQRSTVVVQKEYSAVLEGVVTVDVRPQVGGTLKEIAVDEGEKVEAGQLLFTIDDRPFREALNAAEGSRRSAAAAVALAKIEVKKYKPLVKNKVVSEIKLLEAEAGLQAAEAQLAQALAAVEQAKIDLGYTRIEAPVSGYIGEIPLRIGSLVKAGQDDALTTLTDVSRVHAYFSLSEVDFTRFKQQFEGETLEEKLASVPPVTLELADGSRYGEEGRLDAVSGQFDRTTASVRFRATFPNDNGLLRSGNTGTVQIGWTYRDMIVVPQSATMDLQDRVFVFRVTEDNTVARTPVTVEGVHGTGYLVSGGLDDGDRIVLSGFSRLPDGTPIQPVDPDAKESGAEEAEQQTNQAEGA
ncbi:efflux RND transporter periplasmic adaptor subunit [Prosthecochloris sp. N3]|uniref:Efflux RND transporter periplasmic adaptor subunit n=1 Tax=Prosthecochloris ethylica TaxID=2743976 RepID=A0ABR9XRB2_9CHLB|nr:efflux RND transporter periplasmic adaptor subunit [Prosthecochloris ethylica]MBF0586081.1 efflux RND transporter periplasmic adaptor subunit [Prosthecochloris ethylica]MBF0636519.1 efflux RND transporter periplasmic adaptor subunit [Prosthecochloris ethylica]NUK47151.1 efflux RND transporter periplasmic adaptor subunit [Prosthecochloris ethylica]